MELLSSYFQYSIRYFNLYMCIYFCLSLFTMVNAQASEDDIHIETTPEWVNIRSIPPVDQIPIDDISNGVFFRLVDNQIKVSNNGHRSSYARYVETAVNQVGIDNISQLNIDFDPNYQRLALNSLFIIRDGQHIDKLQSAKISLLTLEEDLEVQIYNGSLTLNVLIDDVREGDTLDYSYTREGVNPIYKGIFSFTRTLNWSIPIHDQYVRLLWGKSKQLFITTRNIEPIINKIQQGRFTEYQVHMHDAKTIEVANELPNWYDPYGVIYFSENENWGEVVKWAEPLYQENGIHPSITMIADGIKQQSSNQSEQITLALKFVQKQIRYVGLEMGVNSHLPTPSHETLELRYGDCKDKTVLLIAILKALNIDTHPALVDTKETKLLAEKPPAVNRFNHVIVTLEHNGERLWLDPTLGFQEGPLSSLFQPNYGFALIVKSGQETLTTMESDIKNSSIHLSEQYFIPENVNTAVPFKVITVYQGNKARQMNNKIDKDGKKELSQNYTAYYQRTYPKLVTQSEMEINSDNASGILTLKEYYSIESFWTKKDTDYGITFYANEVRDAVYKPEQIKRNSPLWFKYPNNITNQIQVEFAEDGWSFDNKEFIEDNAFFKFIAKTTFIDKTLTLTFDYSAKSDHIPHDQIDSYLDARERLFKKSYYGLTKFGDNTNEVSESEWSWLNILITVYLLGLLIITIDWRWESKNRPLFTDACFYPISKFKFMMLSIASLGLYLNYWMYRNWKTIKQEQNSEIMPIARGIFSLFWFYPLFNILKEDSIERFKENKVLAIYLAFIFALLYFLLSTLSSYIEHIILFILVILSPLLFFPFVTYINSLNANDKKALLYNSEWHLRHTITVLLSIPLFTFIFASETPLLPSDSVVTEADIMPSDMEFIYNKKIVPIDEKINYFYSDAILTVRDEGNGFTDNTVFSYWLDDNEQFLSEKVAFENIKGIKVKFAENDKSNTIITITRTDDSNFLLVVSTIDKGDKLFVEKLKEIWGNTDRLQLE